MSDQDKTSSNSTINGVQLHEITPAAEGMSFGALLDKFYMNSELSKGIAENSAVTKAQDFIDGTKVKVK